MPYLSQIFTVLTNVIFFSDGAYEKLFRKRGYDRLAFQSIRSPTAAIQTTAARFLSSVPSLSVRLLTPRHLQHWLHLLPETGYEMRHEMFWLFINIFGILSTADRSFLLSSTFPTVGFLLLENTDEQPIREAFLDLLISSTSELPLDISAVCRSESRPAFIEHLSINDDNPKIRESASKLMSFLEFTPEFP